MAMIEKQGARITGSGQGSHGEHQNFSFNYRQEGLAGLLSITTRRTGEGKEERQVWYGYLIEYPD